MNELATAGDLVDTDLLLNALKMLVRRATREPTEELSLALAEIHEALKSLLQPVRFVDEGLAVHLTGRSVRWLERRHGDWQRVGGARIFNGRRQYRACVLPYARVHPARVSRG